MARWPVKETENKGTGYNTWEQLFPPVLSVATLKKQKGTVPGDVFQQQTDFFSLLRR